MSDINFEEDRVDSVTQIDSSKTLSDKVIELRNLITYHKKESQFLLN